jgi:hypothetical protein
MGCAQSTASVIPTNNDIPIERLYINEDYSMVQTPPVVMITASPPPAYVKSALKKTPFDGRGKTEKLSLFNRKLPPINKTVSFDEQVLVKARTPTPSKIWYEKASSTMPMRKTPRNDDDDYDYDEEEIDSVSSDEEQDNDEQPDIQSRMLTLKSPTLSIKRNPLWSQTNTVGLMPPANPMLEDQSMQRPSFNTNTYATETPTNSSANRIKVRRKQPDLGPPQIVSIPSYQSPIPTSKDSLYQLPAQASIVSPYQSPVKLPSQVFPLQRTLSNPNPVTLTNGESSLKTPYYPINRPPIENIT